MKPVLHTPQAATTSKQKNMVINIVCAFAVVAVVLLLYAVNARNAAKSLHHTKEAIKNSVATDAADAASDSWDLKPSPLRMIQFLQ